MGKGEFIGMKIYQGIDIVEKSRIKKVYKKFGVRFLKKILSNNEISIFKDLKKRDERIIEILASSFSAKESFSKAIGSGIVDSLRFKDIEIIRKKSGKPKIKLSNRAECLIKKKLKSYKKYDLSLSISHERKSVISSVILLLF